jgi:hypothetical protein
MPAWQVIAAGTEGLKSLRCPAKGGDPIVRTTGLRGAPPLRIGIAANVF